MWHLSRRDLLTQNAVDVTVSSGHILCIERPEQITRRSFADPLLGVFTGVFAYYLYETNHRTAPPQQERLQELIKWKQAKTAREEAGTVKKKEGPQAAQRATTEVEAK